MIIGTHKPSMLLELGIDVLGGLRRFVLDFGGLALGFSLDVLCFVHGLVFDFAARFDSLVFGWLFDIDTNGAGGLIFDLH